MGVTQDDIVSQLPLPPYSVLRPNGKAWSRRTIARDYAALDAQWRASAEQNTDETMARMLEHVNRSRQLGYRKEDAGAILNATLAEVKLRGLEPAQKLEHTGPGGGPLVTRIVIEDCHAGGAGENPPAEAPADGGASI